MRRVLLTAPVSAFDYPDPRGAEAARTSLATYLNRVRGTAARPDRFVMCTGSSQGFDLISRALRERGVQRMAVEDPGYWKQFEAIRAMGIETPRVPVDGEGIKLDKLARMKVGAVLVTPAHQYPTGGVMSQERRTALLDWAVRRDALVIEDDYDAEYRFDRKPIGALQGLAPDRVVYVGTASKTLSPALRMAWLIAPADLVPVLEQAKLYADQGSPALEQLALADFIERGELDCHLRKTRLIYRRRRDALAAALARHLPRLRIRGMAAGLHLMVDLEPNADEAAIVAAAAKKSIRVAGASVYHAKPGEARPALVLGYGCIDESVIAEGVRRLAAVVREHSGSRGVG